MNVCIAGGAGYIGSRLVPYLQSRGINVSVIDNLWFGNHLPPEIRVIQKELFDCSSDDFLGIDQVIFLAGVSNDPMAELAPRFAFISNSALPSYIGFCARQAGVRRYIYASSSSVYGHSPESGYTEKDTPQPIYPYGVSKLQGEHGVMSLQNDHFSVISLRQGTVSGHSPRMRFDLFINTMFASAMMKKTIFVRNPELQRPLFDIDDVVRAYGLALAVGPSISGVFNVATKNCSVIEAANEVRNFFAKRGKDIHLLIQNIPDTRSYKVQTLAAERHLGFKPSGSIERILNELHSHYDSYGDPYQDAYWNINIFKNQASSADRYALV